MKHPFHILVAMVIISLLSFSCAPARHVTIMPLDGNFTFGELGVDEPGLEGKWLLARNGEVWEFGTDQAGDVILRINGIGDIEIHLIEYDFGQVMFTYPEDLDEYLAGLSVPLGGLFLVMRDVKEMTLMEIDPRWLERLSVKEPEERWSRKFNDRIYITSTGSVDRLLRKHGDDPGAFRRYGVLRPVEGGEQ